MGYGSIDTVYNRREAMTWGYVRKTTSLAMSKKFRMLPFWERVEAQTKIVDECHLFTGHKNEDGYGRIRGENKQLVFVHRAVWERAHGPIPVGKRVCHRCDTPCCIWLEHLFLGTQADNIKDMDSKGRRRVLRGSEQGMSILVEADIPVIRQCLARGDTCAGIARAYGVSEGMIRHIKKGRAWTHVPHYKLAVAQEKMMEKIEQDLAGVVFDVKTYG